MKIRADITCYRTNPVYRALAKGFLNAPGGQHALALRLLKGHAWMSRALPGINRVPGTRRVASGQFEFEIEKGETRRVVDVRGARWEIVLNVEGARDAEGITDISARFTLLAGTADNVAVSLGMVQDDWSRDCYVCAPGAAYDGNRFDTWIDSFPPFLPPERRRADVPPTTTEIPALRGDASDDGATTLLFPAGDLCTPAIGVLDRRAGRSVWLLSPQQCSGMDVGHFAREEGGGRRAVLGVAVPAVREGTSFHVSSMYPSWDQGASLKKGEALHLRLRQYAAPAGQTMETFFETFAQVRSTFATPQRLGHLMPLSEAWRIHETRYNDHYWDEARSYYRVGQPYTLPEEIWTLGWVGGLQASLALLERGSAQSVERVLRNLAFFFSAEGQSPAGIFYTVSDGTRWGGDDYYLHRPLGTTSWAMVRRLGDGLYYALRHLVLMQQKGMDARIPADWWAALRRCADALCTVWEQNGQFGQYIDPQTLRIHVGGSSGGSIVPAGLLLAWQCLGDERYRRVAEASLQDMTQRFRQSGYTTGGPGDILQAPDSESATNLLESLVVAYEMTGDARWLDEARHAGHYCLTWFLTDDFRFPPGTTFERMGMRTRGACFASVQNKCAVPNICTLSGDALWKLYRYTGEAVFMETIVACLHNTQQYISTRERPIASPKLADKVLEPGNMNECIQTGDWSGPPGEIPYHLPISWSEVANMLGICAIPGIYVRTDLRQVFVADHLDATLVDDGDGNMSLHLVNPTAYDADATLFVEGGAEARGILSTLTPPAFRHIRVPAGGQLSVQLICSEGKPSRKALSAGA